MGSILALLSGFFFALASLSAQLAMRAGATPDQTVMVTLLVNGGIFGLLVSIPGFAPTGVQSWHPVGLLWYACAGILASVIGRMINFRALHLLGPARLNQVVATDALMSVVLAYFLTGERLRPVTILGIVTVTLGVMLLSTEREAVPRPGRQFGLFLGALAALIYALRNILINLGNQLTAAPVWGIAVANWAALLLFLLIHLGAGTLRRSLPPRGRPLGAALFCGLAYVLAWLTLFFALHLAAVSVVTALKNTLPLFALALSWLLLRQEERLNLRIGVSAVIITAGIAVILL
jgi:drug/metabolite transporter, DME family